MQGAGSPPEPRAEISISPLLFTILLCEKRHGWKKTEIGDRRFDLGWKVWELHARTASLLQWHIQSPGVPSAGSFFLKSLTQVPQHLQCPIRAALLAGYLSPPSVHLLGVLPVLPCQIIPFSPENPLGITLFSLNIIIVAAVPSSCREGGDGFDTLLNNLRHFQPEIIQAETPQTHTSVRDPS